MLDVSASLKCSKKCQHVVHRHNCKKCNLVQCFKVTGWGFSWSIPTKFEHRLRRHTQRFGKITTTAVLDKDEICFVSFCFDVLIRVTMTMFKCDCADCLVLDFSLDER